MQRIAFTMRIKAGSQEEYRRRHQSVWPELLADLKQAGCHRYSIYARGLDLFAYMEVEDFQRFLSVMAASQVSQRWEQYLTSSPWLEARGFLPSREGFPVSLEVASQAPRCLSGLTPPPQAFAFREPLGSFSIW